MLPTKNRQYTVFCELLDENGFVHWVRNTVAARSVKQAVALVPDHGYAPGLTLRAKICYSTWGEKVEQNG